MLASDSFGRLGTPLMLYVYAAVTTMNAPKTKMGLIVNSIIVAETQLETTTDIATAKFFSTLSA